MLKRVIALIGVLAFAAAAPVPSAAADLPAPPTLTPAVALDAGDACPGTQPYADALVRGITRTEAQAAAPAFASCAAQDRLPGFRWKTTAATVALAAVDLSRGLLDGDAAAFRRAADATTELRRQSAASDDDVRSWDIIPDSFDRIRARIVVLDYVQTVLYNAETPRRSALAGPWVENAAYINVAARARAAWIHTPRTATGKSYGSRSFGRRRKPRGRRSRRGSNCAARSRESYETATCSGFGSVPVISVFAMRSGS